MVYAQLVTLAFHFIVLGLTLLGIYGVYRTRQLGWIVRAAVWTVGASAVVGAVLSRDGFLLMRLLSYSLFVYLPLLLIASTWIVRQQRALALLGVLVTGTFVAIGIDAFWIEPHWLEETVVSITTEKLDKPIRIALIADLQTDDFGDYEKDAIRRCMSYQPDLILLAGDYVQAESDERWEQVRSTVNSFLAQIKVSAPFGVYAVQGNTDHAKWQNIFEGVDVERIKDTHSFDVQPNIRLTGLAIMDSFDRHLTVEATPQFHIVLGHAPDYALGNINADLLLSGHTHGGQVRLPIIGPLMTASQVPRSWAAGVSQIDDDSQLIVSRGIGMERGNAPRLRFLCRPELVIINIQPNP